MGRLPIVQLERFDATYVDSYFAMDAVRGGKNAIQSKHWNNMTIRAHWGHLTRGNITILRVFGILICPSIEITKVSKPCTLGTQKDADGVGTPLWALLVTVGTFLVAFDFEQLEQLSSIALTHSPTHTHTHTH